MPKPKLVQEDLPLPTPAGVPALDAVAPTEKQAVTAADVARIIASADESVKEQVRIALDLNKTHARKKVRPRTHNETQNTVAAFGEVTHTPDFMPVPPSRISERGPEAEIVWRTRWAEGNGNNLNEYDLDQIAAAASE
jgi:hypothetical protein